ncbi:MAG: type II secretion system protein [Alphaproteobacteria bacterium]
MQKQNGFTLVELAVVMVIVGLLVGGVLKGQAMIENARISATIKQVNEISAANDTFYGTYRAKPGDAPRAENQIAGCVAPNCVSGDGDGRIASDGRDSHSWISNIVTSPFGSESVQFWKHLALADIISGVDGSANPWAPTYGLTHLASKFGGGYEVYFDRSMVVGGGNQHSAMHVLRLNGDINGGRNGVVNTVIAQAIDTKMDDGDPNRGLVFADYGTVDNECKDAGSGVGRDSFYDTANPNNTCVMFFKMFNR